MVLVEAVQKIKARSNKIKEGELYFNGEPIDVSPETAKFLTESNSFMFRLVEKEKKKKEV